jgi:hypothetical protein
VIAGIVISTVASKASGISTCSIAGAVVVLAMAEMARLVVRPRGTNRLEFVASSLQNEANCIVLARNNSAKSPSR